MINDKFCLLSKDSPDPAAAATIIVDSLSLVTHVQPRDI